MRWLRGRLDRLGERFQEGEPLSRYRPIFKMVDTILYTPATVTSAASHVRDGLDLKRTMTLVVVALLPCVAAALYHTGHQASIFIAEGAVAIPGWRDGLLSWLGLGYRPDDVLSCVVHGSLWFVPVAVASFVGGGLVEMLFAVVRRHDVNEGFLVTGTLLPLILPPTIPLWQVVLGAGFGVLLGKEIFGGTGFNFLNPALVCRAFLFFSYPAELSGNVWVAAQWVDGVSSASPLAGDAVDVVTGASHLARLSVGEVTVDGLSWWDAFVGAVPGSMGETSALACAVGALFLLVTRVASGRTMLGVLLGTLAMSALFNAVGSESNPMFAMPFHWHIVLGGWAFGAVFMATDPVSSPITERGRLIYGTLIGGLLVLIRVVNPAYPEGTMLAILFMNMFAPLIDHFHVRANIKRRQARYGR